MPITHRKALQKESMRLKKEMLEAKRRREEELRGKQEAAEDSKNYHIASFNGLPQ